jgi:pyruvate/2-oxoacid:ferredoxin oxidoreductase alpha subunit
MSINPTDKVQVKVITGNAAAAIAVTLCRPDVIAAYPITPQSEIIERLSEFHSQGIVDAEMINVEGENSAMNAVTAASIAGGRVFTASSSWGLAFMYDAVLAAAGTRAPVVMVNVNREPPGIMAVSSGQQDMISTRDAGWIYLVAEDSQEILDMVIMAYRLAEDYEIQLPVMVHYDGFYLSFMAERVEIPTERSVDDYLSVLKEQPQRPTLIPGKPLGVVTHGLLEGYIELRHKHCTALERAKQKFDSITVDFNQQFDRSYAGQVETYRSDDADVVLVGCGSMCGTIKSVIDQKRKEGIKIGLVRLRMYRPFPAEKLTEVLKGKKVIGVVDRSLCFGFKGGPIYTEIRSLYPELGGARMLSFIDGLANMDITTAHIEQIIDTCLSASNGASCNDVTWVCYEG